MLVATTVTTVAVEPGVSSSIEPASPTDAIVRVAKATVMPLPSRIPSLGAGVLVVALLPHVSIVPPGDRGAFGEVEMLSVTPRLLALTCVIRNESLLVNGVAGATTKLSVRKIAPLLS
eukprot:COSAG02_NODE_44018_length_369_cov_1.481481_1_plen_117_part_01